MKFLGIDPGIDITGFAVVDVEKAQRQLLECGVIRTERSASIPERLQMIHQDMDAVISRHEGIVACGVEELFFSKNVKTAFVVGEARGVLLFTVNRFGITIIDMKPVEIKVAVVGHGGANKQDVQRMVQLIFGLQDAPQPDDAADAIAIALAAASRYASPI